VHLPEQNLSRRTLLKGAAWSAPIIAVAAAAPAAMASTGTITVTSSYWDRRMNMGEVRFTVSPALPQPGSFTAANVMYDDPSIGTDLALMTSGSAGIIQFSADLSVPRSFNAIISIDGYTTVVEHLVSFGEAPE
jgi:hypothetical protein